MYFTECLRYIDSWGSGIMKIINSCKAAGLPTPEMKEQEGGFIVTLFKDRFTEEQLQQAGLNERQVKAALYVKERGKITNKEYQEINEGITDRTALRDLDAIVEKGIFRRVGDNKAAYYELTDVG